MRKRIKRTGKTVKAYKNLDFLNSPDARVIRMLAEFLEPQRRFRREGIRHTIVFFGSARTLPRKRALEELRVVERSLSRKRKVTKDELVRLRSAQRAVEMSRYYEDCVILARLLTEWIRSLPSEKRFVVCSGGGPGIMEAANRGATLGGGKSIGMNISLPFEQEANSYITDELNLEFHYFFMRKFWFVYLAKALVIFPGGFGTLDELMEVLTLLQTEKIKKKITVVIYGSEFWNKVIDFNYLVQAGVISKQDLRLFTFLDNPHEAFEHLKTWLTRHYLRRRS
jgi:uncharacterized protein (TIGR00730 family)